MGENEIVLSEDLIVITAEINSYKQVAGQVVFEIGRRLKKVRDDIFNDVKRKQSGDWAKFLVSVEIDSTIAKRIIQAFDQFGDGSATSHLPTSKIFEMLSLPESVDRQEFVSASHTVPSTGECKIVEDMTVKELREVKAELKLKDEELKKEKLAKDALLESVESLKKANIPIAQTTIEVIKEVTPKHVEEELEELRDSLSAEKTDNDVLEQKLIDLEIKKTELDNKLKEIEEYEKSETAEINNLKQQKEKLELQAHISISTLQIKIHNFIKDASPSVFLQGAVASSTFMMRDDLLDSVIALEEFSRTLREVLNAKMADNQDNIIELKKLN